MSSEKFLVKFFEKLTKSDFKKDPFLLAFYKFFKKSQSQDIFRCYSDYVLRNREFADNNERINVLKELYDEIRNEILFKDEDASTDLGFISAEEHKETMDIQQIKVDKLEKPINTVHTNIQKGPVKVNKSKDSPKFV